MSKYTTGEISKLCCVSVRTVQYYDARGILTPSELSEGGRRLYSEEDLKKMKIICFLRQAGLSISSIGQLFSETEPEKVISILLEQQKKEVQSTIAEQQKQLEILEQIQSSLKFIEHFSVETIGDIAHIMKSKQKLRKVRLIMTAAAIPAGIAEWGSIFLWIFHGIWWPFVLYTLFAIPFVVWSLDFSWKNVSYICPQCHTIFKPGKREFFFARHTLTTRKLTCPCCGHKGFCVETGTDETGKAE